MEIAVRQLTTEDHAQLAEAMASAYAGIGGITWKKETIKKLIRKFPEGQLCLTVDLKVVGVALSLIVDYAKFGDNHTYAEITGGYTFSTHNPKGDVLYGIEVFIDPNFRGLRLARRLYDARKNLCESLNLRAIIAGGRIPNYEKYASEYSPREYIEKVDNKEIYDSTLTFQLSNDFHVKKILRNYLPEDSESHGFATLLEWNNIYYEPLPSLHNPVKESVRIGLVQWKMRAYKDLDELLEQAEYFIDAVSDYSSDFILFPEFFNAPLMAEFNHLGEAAAVRGITKYNEQIRTKFQEFAVAYNVNIIAGSMSEMENGQLYNISYLFRRDGTSDKAYKIHPTPSEIYSWGMKGGNGVKVFDTDCGKIGILICYDVEFPELSRHLADQDMQILFVPFWTDTQNAYNRVRYCARARAIENECYVAIAGCVGNLPKVNNMDLQYAQSAVFTPSDFAFPTNGIKAEATPNTETVVVADVDLVLLTELHEHGTVTILKDRRKDLYEITWKTPENKV